MAKQLVSPVERHIEKGVLALAGLALLGVVAKYIVTSPNHLEVGGEMATPGEIDQQVVRKAEAVRQAISRATDTEPMPEPLYPVFMESLDALGAAGISPELAADVPIGPEVPIIDKTPARVGERTLVDVVKLQPDKPVVTHGRSTLLWDPSAPAGTGAVATNWATVSAVFNVREQMEKQQLQYGPKRDQVVFGPVQVERRARRPDGSWSDEDWARVDLKPAGSPGPVPDIKLVKENGVWVAERNNRILLDRFYDLLKHPAKQLELLRPLMPEIRDGDPWVLPIVTNERDVVMMDCEYLFPGQPVAECFENRYQAAEATTREETTTAEAEAPTDTEVLDQAETDLQKAKDNCDQNGALSVYNTAQSVKFDAAASHTDKSRAERIMQNAENLVADITRGICKAGRGAGAPTEQGKQEVEKLPKQQLFAHDARAGSLASGRTYQYRMRATIYNRLAGEPGTFADYRDAQVVFIEGPWTDPSDPVVVDPDTYTFVTSFDQKREDVSIEIFKWFEGVWVKDRERFGIGQAVRHQKRHAVPALYDPEAYEMPLIDFDAGQIVVDIDFQRAHRERNRGARRGGVGFDRLGTTCSVVLMDEDGTLHERFVDLDKSHPGKALVSAKVYRPSR